MFLVTRPDLVLPRIFGFSSTAGAWEDGQYDRLDVAREEARTATGVFLVFEVFALGLAAAVFLVAAFAVDAFFAAGLAAVFALVACHESVTWQQTLWKFDD